VLTLTLEPKAWYELLEIRYHSAYAPAAAGSRAKSDRMVGVGPVSRREIACSLVALTALS
jgi:hypothetical protein